MPTKQKTAQNATPLPWRTDFPTGLKANKIIVSVNKHNGVDTTTKIIAHCEKAEDAELIVRAVNSHQELVEALTWLLSAAEAGQLPEEFEIAAAHKVINSLTNLK